MSRDHINFFWTGKTPSSALLTHLIDWQKYLIAQQTNFRVRLWVTQDIYETKLDENPAITDCEAILLLNNDADEPIVIESVKPLVEQAKIHFPTLTTIYETFLAEKLYSFCSSFIRMLILNHEPGFYCDTDIYPNTKNFPPSLEDISNFASNGYDDKFNPIFGYFNGLISENQVLLTLRPNAFYYDLVETNFIVSADPEDRLKKIPALIQYYQKKLDALKKLIKEDFFLRLHPDFLTYYFQDNSEKTTLSELSQKSDSEQSKEVIACAINFFEIFYHISIRSSVRYDGSSHSTLQKINEFISQSFKNPSQDGTMLCAWSNPIHFHLKEIERKVLPIQSLFRKKRQKKQSAISDVSKKKNPS